MSDYYIAVISLVEPHQFQTRSLSDLDYSANFFAPSYDLFVEAANIAYTPLELLQKKSFSNFIFRVKFPRKLRTIHLCLNLTPSLAYIALKPFAGKMPFNEKKSLKCCF
jgi:hypothetical protein